MILFIIFALLFNVCHANNSFTENKPSHWCNLPYGYVEQSSVRGFNFMEYHKNKSLENLSETIDGIFYIEEWIDIVGYNATYQVSSFGRVKRLFTYHNGDCIWKIISQEKTNRGYFRVALYLGDKKTRKELVHRLVATAFIPNEEGKKTVNHKKCNVGDNRSIRLEWATQSENVRHAMEMGVNNCQGEGNGSCKISDVISREIFLSKLSLNKTATLYGVSKKLVLNIKKRKAWKHATKDL